MNTAVTQLSVLASNESVKIRVKNGNITTMLCRCLSMSS